MKFLDPLSLAKLSSFQIRVRYVVEGILSGLHTSRYKGQSLEFAQHREYVLGDELKYIDWKVYGRSDKFFIKQFQDETNLRAYILLDCSGSMKYRSKGRENKLTYAAYLTASLSYLLLRQEDSVGLGAFDENIRFYVPPLHQMSHLKTILEKLENLSAGGDTGIENVLKAFGPQIKRRGLLILISDLLGDSKKIVNALKYFRYRHHQVMVLHVLDPDEINLPYAGENVFLHLEKSAQISCDADVIRTEYKNLFREFLEEYKTGFRSSGIDYFLITTDTPLEVSLGKCLGS